jgi:hypothetical protein
LNIHKDNLLPDLDQGLHLKDFLSHLTSGVYQAISKMDTPRINGTNAKDFCPGGPYFRIGGHIQLPTDTTAALDKVNSAMDTHPRLPGSHFAPQDISLITIQDALNRTCNQFHTCKGSFASVTPKITQLVINILSITRFRELELSQPVIVAMLQELEEIFHLCYQLSIRITKADASETPKLWWAHQMVQEEGVLLSQESFNTRVEKTKSQASDRRAQIGAMFGTIKKLFIQACAVDDVVAKKGQVPHMAKEHADVLEMVAKVRSCKLFIGSQFSPHL